MSNGYRELVLTLQNIMYSDSELKYITKERNITQFRIERICNSNKEEIAEEATYKNSILIKKNTVKFLESLGYNLFRQFETSQDYAYYERPLLRESGDAAYETRKLVTILEYSVDIYCYAMPPPYTTRRFPVVSSTIHVSTHPFFSSSESTVDTSLAHNLYGLEYISDISHPASGFPRSSFGYTHESIWGSTSPLPTDLLEPISHTFWNNLSSEELSSDSDEITEPGGVFVKLATLSSTKSGSNSTSKGSTLSACDDEIRDTSNLKEIDNHESSNPRVSEEGLLMRNNNPGTSFEGTVSRRNENPGISGEGTALMRNFNPTSSDSSVASCIKNVHFDLGEVTNVGNRMKEEYENSSECDVSEENYLKAIHEDIKVDGSRNLGISIQTNDNFSRRMNVNKRTASSAAESSGSGFWSSKEPKQNKLSIDATELRPSHSKKNPLELLMIGNTRHSINSSELQESDLEKVDNAVYREYTDLTCFNPPSTFHSNNTDQEILNMHTNITEHCEEKVTNINNEHSSCDKFSQTDCSEDKPEPNISSMVMNRSSNNDHTSIEHSDLTTVVEHEYSCKFSDNPQHSSSADSDIQRNKNSRNNLKPFDTLQALREDCENWSYLDRMKKEINSAPSHSLNSLFSQNETINQYISSDQIQDQIAASDVIDIYEDVPLDNSISESEEYFPFDTTESGTSRARIERTLGPYPFLNQNRITETLNFDLERLTGAPKSNWNPQNHEFQSPLHVPMVWSQKCVDLQYLLALKLSKPFAYIQEYNRIRKSKLNILDCLRKRESLGALHQTKVMEVIARPHYHIFPPADEEETRTMLEDVEDEEEIDLDGYLMVSMATHRTFSSFAANSK